LNTPETLLSRVADELDGYERLTGASVLLFPLGFRDLGIFAVKVHDAGSRLKLFAILVADDDSEIFAGHVGLSCKKRFSVGNTWSTSIGSPRSIFRRT
jgi:hypothetical protein